MIGRSSLKLFGKILALFLSVALFAVMSVSASGAHAQTIQHLRPATDTSNCVRQHYSSHDVFCSGPVITSYCGSGQYWTEKDGYGKYIDWTKTDQNNTCVNVTFNLYHSFSSCDIDMYIPNADSSATFTYYWYDGYWHQGTFNENPVDGWQYLFTASTATTMYFTDHDYPGNLHLGWGSSSSDGVRITCG